MPGFPDLPESCLEGRLGEICTRHLKHFPRAYAYMALLAIAGASLDQAPEDAQWHVNQYTLLVGPTHSGKSQAIEWALHVLGMEKPTLVRSYAGSAEALARGLRDAMGNPRLLAIDEFSHVLKKGGIEGATIFPLLCEMFYHRDYRMLSGKKEVIDLACQLSFIGGVVDDQFENLFTAESTMGLYDRLLFGLCPDEFEFDYEPVNGLVLPVKRPLDSVRVDPDVHEWVKQAKHDMNKSMEVQKKCGPVNPRVIEICLRAALTCCAIDGAPLLTVDRLNPVVDLVEYQTKVRRRLRPNPGETPEGRMTVKIRNFLTENPGWHIKRVVFDKVHAERPGFRIADGAIYGLVNNGIVDLIKVDSGKPGRKIVMVKLSADDTPLPPGSSEEEENED